MVKGLPGTDRPLPITGRLRSGIRVERRPFDLAAAGPESGADYFMRIGFAGDRVRSFALRSAPSGKARDRQIETSPKKMYRAVLADEARTEFTEDAVCDQENPPEPGRILTIIGCMLSIAIKSNGIGNFDRHAPDLYINAERCQRGREILVEISHRAWRQRNRRIGAFTGLYDQVVMQKIELYLEDAAL